MMRGSLAELEAVLAVSSRGGFRAAARELGISSSSLSQQIAALEARMGVRIFQPIDAERGPFRRRRTIRGERRSGAGGHSQRR